MQQVFEPWTKFVTVYVITVAAALFATIYAEAGQHF